MDCQTFLEEDRVRWTTLRGLAIRSVMVEGDACGHAHGEMVAILLCSARAFTHGHPVRSLETWPAVKPVALAMVLHRGEDGDLPAHGVLRMPWTLPM